MLGSVSHMVVHHPDGEMLVPKALSLRTLLEGDARQQECRPT